MSNSSDRRRDSNRTPSFSRRHQDDSRYSNVSSSDERRPRRTEGRADGSEGRAPGNRDGRDHGRAHSRDNDGRDQRRSQGGHDRPRQPSQSRDRDGQREQNWSRDGERRTRDTERHSRDTERHGRDTERQSRGGESRSRDGQRRDDSRSEFRSDTRTGEFRRDGGRPRPEGQHDERRFERRERDDNRGDRPQREDRAPRGEYRGRDTARSDRYVAGDEFSNQASERARRAAANFQGDDDFAEPREPVGLQQGEQKIYGVNSCLAFFKQHPDRVIRAYLTEQAAKTKFAELMKSLAQAKKAYHIVDDQDLEKVTESNHHEGVCLLIKSLPEQDLVDWLVALPEHKTGAILMLDRVANPHNLGAILRVAAHYNVLAVVTMQPAALRSGAAMRTSEGGALHVPVLSTHDLVKAVELLQKNRFTVLATSSYHSQDLYQTTIPSRAVFILGEEKLGVADELIEQADSKVIIGGSGLVESLNVSVASALLCSEYWRQHNVTTTPTERASKAPAKSDDFNWAQKPPARRR